MKYTHLYLVKSNAVKARYFFTDEEKARALFEELATGTSDLELKYLKTSDEWEIEELVAGFKQMKELL